MSDTQHRQALAELDRADLEARLREAEETLDAIRYGDVDAVVVSGPSGQQVYTLENADRPYRVLIEQMQEGAITLSADGTILYCNQRFARLMRRQRETMIGDGFARFLRACESRSFEHMIGQCEAGASGEFSLLVADGGEVAVNVSMVDLKVDTGLPRVVCAVVTDLTHNRRRSQELAAANERLAVEIIERRRAEDSLRVALEAADMGSWEFDLASGTTRRSLRHDQIFGHENEVRHWSLQSALDQVLSEDQPIVRKAFDRAEIRGSIEFETRIRRANDGVLRWLAVKGQTFYEHGRAVRIAGIVSDVTERRVVEEQLRQAQKMEAVGQLTGGIAHDFNNLLMVIGGSLEVITRRVTLDDKIKRLANAAQDAVTRGAKLTHQLLTFSRRQTLQAEVICVDQLIPSFEHLLERAVGETIKLAVERADQVWFCRADPHQLENAVLNLAINARDAMPGGGTFTLATRNRSLSAAEASRWEANAGDYVAVSLADTGTGMSPEVLRRVFEPFFTTKGVGQGTGLGLSQVYGFAKQSGGFVTIDSELRRGTTVTIHLPRIDQVNASAVQLEPEASDVDGRGIVLVVDDDHAVRLASCSMLRELGYAVREAESGPAALKLLGDGRSVDLVFSDVIMPDGMSGLDLAREVRQRWPGLPILLTSGYTAQRGAPHSQAHGLPVLRKPFSLQELGQAAIDAMGYRG